MITTFIVRVRTPEQLQSYMKGLRLAIEARGYQIETETQQGAEQMQPIAIPYSESRGANEKRHGAHRTDIEQCLLCSSPVNPETAKTVILAEDCGEIIDPESPEAQGERNGGCFYIGPDCWKRNTALHAYQYPRPGDQP